MNIDTGFVYTTALKHSLLLLLSVIVSVQHPVHYARLPVPYS